MFGLNLTNQRVDTGNDAQKQFAGEMRKLIRRFSRQLNGGRISAEKGTRSRTLLARIDLERTTYLVICAPRQGKSLPPQQRRIALFVAEGLTNKEIAQRMKIKVNTVTSHLSKIYLRLDIHSRVSLARHFMLAP